MKIYTETEAGNKSYKTDTFKCKIYKSKDNKYEMCEIDNKKFIIVKNIAQNYVDFLNNSYEYITINTFDLLNSLLKLYENISKSKYYEMIDIFEIQDNKIFQLIEKDLNGEDFEKIINWCSIYGLPFLGELEIKKERTNSKIEKYKCFGFTNDLKTCINNNICGFRVGVFLVGLHIIYKTAVCANKLYEINQDINRDNNKNLDKAVLEDYIKRTTQALQTTYEFEDNSNYTMYNLELYANTLLSAAMYTLKLWVCSPNYFFIKRCINCGVYFASKDPRNLYCNNPCDRYNVYKNRMRNNSKKK